jgi:arabinofuranan 3-O-arabinosyltransferase
VSATETVGRPVADANPSAGGRRRLNLGAWLTVLIPAVLTYVPLLFTQPGEVGADTKTYLYLNPGKVLSDAPYVWNSQIGMGTVTHQYIGYLWPMGPFYWLFQQIGVPDWVAQRIWLGSVMLAAGLGVRYLCRTLGWATTGEGDRSREAWGGILVASLAYMFSPYLLEYAARISVILLPWAALPWMIALTARALRRGGWRYPALFALVVLTVGGINATALIMIGTGPLLYVAWATFVEHEVTGREALATMARMGVLTVATSLWWIAGLWAEGKYGLPVTRYTETYKTVAEVSSAPEVLRGLGYWFFYGDDKLGPWTAPSATYTTNVAAVGLSYLIPFLAILAAALVRWRYRALFLGIVVVGAFTAIASHPWSNPSLLGALFKAFTRTDAGLALRSTPRAVPLVVLGLAMFLGAGVSALGRQMPRYTLAVSALAAVLLFANLSTLWTGQMVAQNLKRPETIPSYYNQAAQYLQSQGDSTRVLEVPGSDFASYRWGNTVDPVLPGLMDRPYVAHELFQYGSAQSASLLDAFDSRFAEGDMDPASIAPIARLMGVGDIVDRSDLQYERYRTARPVPMWDTLTHTSGLGAPVAFGTPTPNVAGPQQPMIDEVALGTDPSLPNPPPLASFAVNGATPIVRTHPASGSLLFAGSADGLVDSAGLGILGNGSQADFFSASYADNPSDFKKIYGADADLVVTDTNRKRAERWGTIREQTGYTEEANEVAPYDPTDQRLEVFPDQTSADQTVSEQRGGATVTATDYGNPVTYTPDDRPANAMDGDPESAWRVGALENPVGARLKIDLAHSVTTDHLQLLQPINLTRNRWITQVALHFDNRPAIVVNLGDPSRAQPGQTVHFPTQTFEHLQIEVRRTNIGTRPEYNGLSGVGFAEVSIPGVKPVDELIRPPTDLLTWAGTSSLSHRLIEVFTRLRSDPAEPVRLDEEVRMNRIIDLPTARSFSITGSAALSDYVSDGTIDSLLGIPDAAQGGITANSSGHLQGSIDQRASAALDGDPTTFWSGRFDSTDQSWLSYTFAQPTAVSHLDLQVVADGRHSVPTQLTIVPDGDQAKAVTVKVPAVADQSRPNATVAVPVSLPTPVTGTTLQFDISGERVVHEKDWYSDTEADAPVAIAELGIPGERMAAVPTTFDSGCRTDLITIDGRPVPVRITGSVTDAVARTPMTMSACGGPINLDKGEHILRTATGRDLGIDVDQIALASDKGGRAMPLAQAVSARQTEAPTAPKIETLHTGRVSYDLSVPDAHGPFWLAVDQSWSDGWQASIDGKVLPPPQVIDGYGNGWLINPADYGKGPLLIHTEWKPQSTVWIALVISALGIIVALALVLFSRGRRRVRRLVPSADHPTDPTLETPRRDLLGVVGARATTVAAATLGVFVALTTPFLGLSMPIMVVVVVGLVLVVYRHPRGRGILALVGGAALGLAALYTVQGQLRHPYPADFVWALQFDRVNVLGLLAIFMLLAEAGRELLIRRHTDPRLPEDPDG